MPSTEFSYELTTEEKLDLFLVWGFSAKEAGRMSLSEDRLSDWASFGLSWRSIMEHYEYAVTIDFCKHRDAAHTWACNVCVGRDYQFDGYGATQTVALHRAALKVDEAVKAGVTF